MGKLHDVAERGAAQDLDALLATRQSDVNERDEFGDTPLHNVVRKGRLKAIRVLLKHGADVNARGEQGKTPLIAAAFSDKISSAVQLIQSGANLELADDNEMTPLLTAAYRIAGLPNDQVAVGPERSMVTELLSGGASYDLESAVVLGDFERVTALLDQQPDALLRLPPSRQTRIVFAALQDADIMTQLLQSGGNPNAHLPGTPFDAPLITQVSDPSVAEALLTHGAIPNVVDSQGRTPLEQAIRYSQDDLVALLRRFGAK